MGRVNPRDSQAIEQRLSLWSANVFPRQAYAPSLDLARAVEAHFPSMLDHILEPQDRRCLGKKVLVSCCSSFANVRDHHLYVPIATKTAFFGHLGDMMHFRAAIEGVVDSRILVRQPSKNRDQPGTFIGNCFNPHDSSAWADLIVDGDLRAFF
jgi:hypothetical protein